ncbi:MAG: phosphatidate cytidylyltransferase [Frankiaceae bacterium]
MTESHPVAEQAPAAPPPAQGGRAGRDLPAAIGVGLGLGAVVVTTLLAYRPAFVAIVAVAVGLGLYELVQALAAGGRRLPLVPLLAGTVAMVAAAYAAGPGALAAALAGTVVVVVLWRLTATDSAYLPDVAASALAATYVPFLAGFAVLLLRPANGDLRVITFIATVVCSDVGGYAAGVLFGRHPMAPTVSPKKSWEGFAGSTVACVLGGIAFLTLLLHGAWWQGALYGLAVVCSATVGDLGESMLKRDLGIKDMGTLLPGHGGVMDRLDSLLPTAPVAWLLLSTLLPPS